MLLTAAEDGGGRGWRGSCSKVSPPSPLKPGCSPKSLVSVVTDTASARTFSYRKRSMSPARTEPTAQDFSRLQLALCFHADPGLLLGVSATSVPLYAHSVIRTAHRKLGLIFPAALKVCNKVSLPFIGEEAETQRGYVKVKASYRYHLRSHESTDDE